MSATDAARMLGALSDGRRWSTSELYGLNLTPHSRKSDLAKLGYTVSVGREQPRVAGEKAIYWYRLEAVPAVAPPLEEQLEDGARAAIDRMRFAGRAGVPANDAGVSERGRPGRGSSRPLVDRDNEAAPPTGAPAGAVRAAPAAPFVASGAGAPPGGVVLSEVLLEELAGIEGQLAVLAAEVLTFEDVELLEELEARRDEILRSWSGCCGVRAVGSLA